MIREIIIDKLPTLSICMIVKNEKENLKELLPLIQSADEIIIVDTGSTDGTVQMAATFTEKLYLHEWDDSFAEARNVGLEKATGDYILWLDADDRIDNVFIKQLKTHLYANKDTAVWVRLVNKKETGDIVSYQLRVIPNLPSIRFEGRVHEQLAFSVERENIPYSYTNITVVHLGYMDESLLKDKMKRNMELLFRAVGEDTNTTNQFFWCTSLSKTLFELGYAVLSLYYAEKAFEYRKQIKAMSSEWMASLYNVTASIHSMFKNKNKAVELLSECRDLYPNNRGIRYALSQLFMEMKKYAEAHDELQIFMDNKITVDGLPINLELVTDNIRISLLVTSLYVGDYDVVDGIMSTITNDPKFRMRRPLGIFK